MKLKSVIFYQGVKLWDNNMYATVLEGKNNLIEDVTITIENHLITLSCPKYPSVVIVGTSNMRCANATKEEVEGTFPEATELGDPRKTINIGSSASGAGQAEASNKGSNSLNGKKDDEGSAQTTQPSGFDASKYAGKPAEIKVEKPEKAPGMSKAEKLAAIKKADKSK